MNIRDALLGPPLPLSAEHNERVSTFRAVGTFGLDALASTVYGPDEIFYVLVLAGTAGAVWGVPVALAIVLLLLVVATSYRQTIFAYPNGGGSYTVARENLGSTVGVVAAVALMVDYLTNIAVSVTAGIGQIAAFVPGLYAHRVAAAVACIIVMMIVNLRGVREASFAFLVPTYAFVGSLALLVAWGLVQAITGHLHPAPQALPAAGEGLTLVLLLRAFSGGCTALTGIEAISNGVPVFTEPRSRTAARTLLFLTVTLATLFAGVAVLGSTIRAVPAGASSVVAQIGLAVAGQGPLFYAVQVTSAIVLILAANTSFNGFPSLAATMAKDNYLPHQFAHRGLRLVYSNGIVVLGALAIALVIAFGGSTHLLIPLFAVGVFLCFTLSQAGMVRHWLRRRGLGWRVKLVINGVGACTTALVTLIMTVTKFTEGAWLVLLLIPILAVLIFSIHAQYAQERAQVRPAHFPPAPLTRHVVLVLVSNITYAVEEAVAYATTLSPEARAVHVAEDAEYAERLASRWKLWGEPLPLDVIDGPYGEVVEPLRVHITGIARTYRSEKVTVLVPEVVGRRRQFFPRRTMNQVKQGLHDIPNVNVVTVSPSAASQGTARGKAYLRVI
ncbi:MAG: APC family permease [Chloroflexota bacterium]